MALFSDIDWVIVVAVVAFLLFGKGNTEVLRTMGRWYGRAGRLKQDLLSEFTRAADLPMPGTAGPGLVPRGAPRPRPPGHARERHPGGGDDAARDPGRPGPLRRHRTPGPEATPRRPGR